MGQTRLFAKVMTPFARKISAFSYGANGEIRLFFRLTVGPVRAWANESIWV
jgi:hypothetical protein